jgi:hypothetical protein
VISVFLLVRGRARTFARPQALVLAILVFAAAEIAPMRSLWPSTPSMFLAMTGHTLNTPGMRWSTPGFLQRGVRGTTTIRSAPTETTSHGVVRLGVDMVRRVFGPFPWIAPHTWTFFALQQGQYYLFPGTVLWYALLPFVVLGFALSGAAMVRGMETRFPLLLLWWFSALYFAQYLLINLSFRQREDGMPILLMFAALGADRFLPDCRRPPRWYRRYWVVIVVIAVLHITVRAILDRS